MRSNIFGGFHKNISVCRREGQQSYTIWYLLWSTCPSTTTEFSRCQFRCTRIDLTWWKRILVCATRIALSLSLCTFVVAKVTENKLPFITINVIRFVIGLPGLWFSFWYWRLRIYYRIAWERHWKSRRSCNTKILAPLSYKKSELIGKCNKMQIFGS